MIRLFSIQYSSGPLSPVSPMINKLAQLDRLFGGDIIRPERGNARHVNLPVHRPAGDEQPLLMHHAYQRFARRIIMAVDADCTAEPNLIRRLPPISFAVFLLSIRR